MMGPNSLFWYFCESFVYRMDQPAPRQRTVPMEVIAVGLPRSATESLKEALLFLGYKDCYHGYDLIFDGDYMPLWARLIRQKHFPSSSRWSPFPKARSEALISAEEFDVVLGNCRAVTDSPASAFAYDLIHAYPKAKIILNQRKDLDRWTTSINETLVAGGKHPVILIACWFNSNLWWMWHVFFHLMYPAVFSHTYGGFEDGVAGKAKHINLEHSAMVRGAVSKERLLEWTTDQGWEPLCHFLGKEIPPDTPFPSANAGSLFAERRNAIVKGQLGRALRNMVIIVAGSGLLLYVTMSSTGVNGSRMHFDTSA